MKNISNIILLSIFICYLFNFSLGIENKFIYLKWIQLFNIFIIIWVSTKTTTRHITTSTKHKTTSTTTSTTAKSITTGYPITSTTSTTTNTSMAT